MATSTLTEALSRARDEWFSGRVMLRRPSGESYTVTLEAGMPVQVDTGPDVHEPGGKSLILDRVRQAVLAETVPAASADLATRGKAAARRLARIAHVPGETSILPAAMSIAPAVRRPSVIPREDPSPTPVRTPTPSRGAARGSAPPGAPPVSVRTPSPASVRPPGSSSPLALALARAREERLTGGVILRRPSGESYTVSVHDGAVVGVEIGPDRLPPGGKLIALDRVRDGVLAEEAPIDPSAAGLAAHVRRRLARIIRLPGEALVDPTLRVSTPPAPWPDIELPGASSIPPAQVGPPSAPPSRPPSQPLSGPSRPVSRPRIAVPASIPPPSVPVGVALPPLIKPPATPTPPSVRPDVASSAMPMTPPSVRAATRPPPSAATLRQSTPGFRPISVPEESRIRIDTPPQARRTDPDLLREAARMRLNQRDYAGAYEILRNRLPQDGADPEMDAMAAWVAANLKADLETPLADLNLLVRANPRCEHALYYRGLVLKRAGQIKAALRDFVTLVKLHPRHGGALMEIKELRTLPDHLRE
jgi:hypothetical protein